jgi:CheY-like chemotaxis protein
MSDSINFSVPEPNSGSNIPADMIAGTDTPQSAPDEGDSGASSPCPANAAPESKENKSGGENNSAAKQPEGASLSALGHAALEAARAMSPVPCGTSPEPRAERRRKRRALISAPVRVRGVDITTESGPDEITTTVDVSRLGILFHTSHAFYYRGMDVAVTFPYTKAPDMVPAEQLGRVARVHELGNGRRAVAVALGVGVGEDLVDSCGRKLDLEPVRIHATLGLPNTQKPVVLIVDADCALRDSLKTYLNNEGYNTITVTNAAEAREVIKTTMPALVIAEVEGEGLPGFELCAFIKGEEKLKHIPVVMITRSAYPSDYSNAHSLGAVVCMAKPFKQDRLGHVVRLLAPTQQALERSAVVMRRGGCSPNASPARKSNANGNGNGNSERESRWYRFRTGRP